MIYNNILEAIGHTPMIRLNRMNKAGNAEILVKFEGLNVGGSIKTRTAYNMIKAAEKEGKINQNTVISIILKIGGFSLEKVNIIMIKLIHSNQHLIIDCYFKYFFPKINIIIMYYIKIKM